MMPLFEPLIKALNEADVRYLVPFEDLWSRSVEFVLQNTKVRVASIPNLIHLKRLAGRPAVLSDIERLGAIQRAKGEAKDG